MALAAAAPRDRALELGYWNRAARPRSFRAAMLRVAAGGKPQPRLRRREGLDGAGAGLAGPWLRRLPRRASMGRSAGGARERRGRGAAAAFAGVRRRRSATARGGKGGAMAAAFWLRSPRRRSARAARGAAARPRPRPDAAVLCGVAAAARRAAVARWTAAVLRVARPQGSRAFVGALAARARSRAAVLRVPPDGARAVRGSSSIRHVDVEEGSPLGRPPRRRPAEAYDSTEGEDDDSGEDAQYDEPRPVFTRRGAGRRGRRVCEGGHDL